MDEAALIERPGDSAAAGPVRSRHRRPVLPRPGARVVYAFRLAEGEMRRGLERLEADSTWIRLREAWPDSLAEPLGGLAEIQALRLRDLEFQMPA